MCAAAVVSRGSFMLGWTAITEPSVPVAGQNSVFKCGQLSVVISFLKKLTIIIKLGYLY